MSFSNKIIDYDLHDYIYNRVDQASQDGDIIPVIIRFNPNRFNTVWKGLASGTMIQLTEYNNDVLKNLKIDQIMRIITPTIQSREILEQSVPDVKMTEKNQHEGVQKQIHSNYIRIRTIDTTTKLDLTKTIRTELDAVSIRSLFDLFEKHPNIGKEFGIEYFERNREVELPPPPILEQQFVKMPENIPSSQIGVNPNVWSQGYKGSGVTIAVIDSGVDENHPDIKGKIRLKKDFTELGDNGEDVRDTTTHGTHVAGTIAGSGHASSGRYMGIAPEAQLIIGRVFYRTETGTVLTHKTRNQMSTISDAIVWAYENGADVISLSLGQLTPNNGQDEMSQTIDRIAEKGVVVVVAAGNFGRGSERGKRQPKTIGAPAASPNALTVGANLFDPSMNGYKVAEFSSIGPVEVSSDLTNPINIKPDIVAPGVDILAPLASGQNLSNGQIAQINGSAKNGSTPIYTNIVLEPSIQQFYTFKSGTSMATPIVSGSVALILDAFKKSKGITNDIQWQSERSKPIGNSRNVAQFVKEVIMETAQKLEREPEYDLANFEKSIVSGEGMILVDRCIDRILNYRPLENVVVPTELSSTKKIDDKRNLYYITPIDVKSFT